MYKFIAGLLICCTAAVSCTSGTAGKKEEAPAADSAAGTPVTITTATTGAMTETVDLNAVSAFLLKTYVKANATGYLQQVNTQMGSYVNKGQELFVLKTKEAQSLGNSLNILDSALHFSGNIRIVSPANGYVTQLTYRAGDYVQDNEQLATITDTRNFVFLLELPYELSPYIASNKNLRLTLPDGSVLDGHIENAMPTVDAVSQTQRYMIKVNTSKIIPENLLAKVSLVKRRKDKVVYLPREAVLSDETQQQFWIMKMIDSARAVKIPVTRGMENKEKVEILSPALTATDKILLTGNYGLPDTARVSIHQ